MQLLEVDQRIVDTAAREHMRYGQLAVDAFDSWVLRKVPEAATAYDRAERRLDIATEHLEEAGLPGTVAADQADLVPGHDGEAGALDDIAAAHLHRHITNL